MIDPANITKFDRTDSELEEFAIFAILVAGKTAKTVAPRLEQLLKPCNLSSPLFHLYLYRESLGNVLKNYGFGCYNQKANTIIDLAQYVIKDQVFNLRTCEPWQMEIVKGIGFKTSRFFIMHSRPDARVAALDTHILKGLRKHTPMSINVPTSTPGSQKEYRRWENQFLFIADSLNMTPAELDLKWWREYSGN